MSGLSRRARASTVLLLLTACRDSTGVGATDSPKAFIRYVNAMPDTLGVDFHAVDIVENSPYIATLFRDIKQAGYTPVAAGPRHFRVFLSDPGAPVASTVSHVLVDTTLTLETGAHYTIAQAGFARTGVTPRAAFVVLRDGLPTPPAGQIAVRVLNLAAGLGSVDVYVSTSGSGPVPLTPVFVNASFLTPTTWISMPTSATLSFRATVTGAGSAAVPLAVVAAPPGDLGTTSLDPIPGSAIAGSVFTVYLFSRSSPGSLAPQTTEFLAPAMVVVPDIHLHARPPS
jgi:hypothetical protein